MKYMHGMSSADVVNSTVSRHFITKYPETVEDRKRITRFFRWNDRSIQALIPVVWTFLFEPCANKYQSARGFGDTRIVASTSFHGCATDMNVHPA
ncbi:MAG: hypothetical protein WKF77_12665 [Planctomycetaceae bacterium]